jgi:hypothetical protein
MMNRSLFAGLVLFAVSGCVKEISSDERLERESGGGPDVREAITASDLKAVKCDELGESLKKARDENRNETDRVQDYHDLYKSLMERSAKFDEAMTRNPDLAYKEGSQEIVAAKDSCVKQTADIKVEFESYVRELVSMPTVSDVKSGTPVTVARLDFNTLRSAIDILAPDDRDALLTKVNNAEKKIEVKADPTRKKAGGK